MKQGLIIFIFCVISIFTYSQEQDWHYVDLGTTSDITDVFFLNETDGFLVIGGDPCTVKKTTDGGLNWTTYNMPISNVDIKSIFFINQNKGWAAGEFSSLLLTNDGGETWSKIAMPDTSFYYGVEFFDENHGFIVADSTSYILESNDGGLNWTKVDNVLFGTTGFRTIDFINSITGFIAGRGGKIFRTDDNGATWVSKNYSSPKAFSGISFIDSLTGWVVGSQGLIVSTLNGGNSWSSQASNVTITFKSVNFFNANFGLASGQEGTVVKTTNGGLQWDTVYTANELDLKSAFIVSETEAWVCGETGTVLHYKEGSSGLSNGTNTEIESLIFPNPITTESVLQLQINEKADVKLDFFDAYGRLIMTETYSNVYPGENSFKLFPSLGITESNLIVCRSTIIYQNKESVSYHKILR